MTNFITFYRAVSKNPNALYEYIGEDEKVKTFNILPFVRRMHMVTSPRDVEHVLYDKKYERDASAIKSLRDMLEDNFDESEDYLTKDARIVIESIAEEKEAYYTQVIIQSLEKRFAVWNEFVNSAKVFNLERELTCMAIFLYLDTLLGGIRIDDVTEAADVINEIFFCVSPYTYYFQALGKPWIPFTGTLRKYNDYKSRAKKIGKELLERTLAQKDDTKFNFLKLMATRYGYDLANLSKNQKSHLAGRAFGTLISATHNLTGILCHLLVMLSQYPTIKEHIRAEVDSVVGNRLPTYDDYKKLVYTKAAFLETIRLHPGVVNILRLCKNDDNVSGTLIKKGDNVFVPASICHKLTKYWDNPEGFEPARFMKPLTPDQEILFLGFSHGPQGCIGRKFASLESTLFLAMLVKRFDLNLKPHTSLSLDKNLYFFFGRLNRDVTMRVQKIFE